MSIHPKPDKFKLSAVGRAMLRCCTCQFKGQANSQFHLKRPLQDKEGSGVRSEDIKNSKLHHSFLKWHYHNIYLLIHLVKIPFTQVKMQYISEITSILFKHFLKNCGLTEIYLQVRHEKNSLEASPFKR